jgi:hypothetical protein
LWIHITGEVAEQRFSVRPTDCGFVRVQVGDGAVDGDIQGVMIPLIPRLFGHL